MKLSPEARSRLATALQLRFVWGAGHADEVVSALEVALSHEPEPETEGAEPSLNDLHGAFMRVKHAAVVSVELDRFLQQYRVVRR